MKTVHHILTQKGEPIYATSPDTPVLEALEKMAEKDVGALIVMEGDRLVGIFSERDYARKVILKGKASKDTLVREIMTSQVITIRPNQSIYQCMAEMNKNNIRHLPVVEKNRVVGLISIGDVLQSIIEDQESTIEPLKQAVTGSDPVE